jgi:hypothetical protein
MPHPDQFGAEALSLIIRMGCPPAVHQRDRLGGPVLTAQQRDELSQRGAVTVRYEPPERLLRVLVAHSSE